MLKVWLNKENEKGQALILVLILLLLGGLMIPPLLAYMSTGLKTGQVFERKTEELYAADAGVEDAICQIKYDHLITMFPAYHPYDYTISWRYDLSENVNDRVVNVTVQNVWIPKDLTFPSKSNSERIIEGIPEDPPEPAKPPKVIIVGSVPTATTFQIKIVYYPEAGEELTIDRLGIWLPSGFHYDEDGGCNLEDYYTHRQIVPHAGGEAVVWSLASYPFAGSDDDEPFPGVNPAESPMASTVTFQFTGPSRRSPEAVSWIDTNLDLTQGGSPRVSYTWDADTKVYHITSVAGDTDIEAYVAKSEIRELGSGIAGDYRAIGNSLMIDQYPDWGGPRRDTLLDESSATVDDIPLDASVSQARLYWSAWLAGADEQIFFQDQCSDFSDWSNPGSDWGISSRRFRGHHLGSEAHRYLTMKDSLNLSSAPSGSTKVKWTQSVYRWWAQESGDCLKFEFSNDGGSSWSGLITAFCHHPTTSSFSYIIPDEYLTEDFKMRFYLDGFGGSSEYVYIDNIGITASLPIADTSVTFKVNNHQEEVTTYHASVLENKPDTFSYACYLDVTELVKEHSTNYTGNGEYTVGDVDADTGDEWSYAGWSLIIIYTSAETKGHQLYLYDDFTYVDNDETLEFPISGFLVPDPVEGEENAATLTCFVGEGDDYYDWDYLKFNGTSLSDGRTTSDVWNSWSRGMSEDGVDVDTFYVTWASDLLEPGDSSAQVDMPTRTDSWNLVYIILSFRSETATGGTVTYLIRG